MTSTALVSLQALKAADLCASTEKARFYLQGVLVTVEARRTTYVATNGHVMFCHVSELGADDPDNTFTGEWLIPSTAIAKLKLRKGDLPATLWPGEGQAAGQLCITHARTGDVVMAAPIDGSFPDWRRVVPGACDATKLVERAAFNPALVGLFAEVAEKMESSPIGVVFHTNGADEPAAVTFAASAGQSFGGHHAITRAVVTGDPGQLVGPPCLGRRHPPAVETPAPVAIAAE